MTGWPWNTRRPAVVLKEGASSARLLQWAKRICRWIGPQSCEIRNLWETLARWWRVRLKSTNDLFPGAGWGRRRRYDDRPKAERFV